MGLYTLFTMYSTTLQPSISDSDCDYFVSHHTFLIFMMASEKIVICGAGFLGITFNTVILVCSTVLTLETDIKALILPKQLPWRTIQGQH